MTRSIRIVLLITFVTFLIGLPTSAETPDQARIKQLEAENDALRLELAQLRLALTQLKQELESHRAKPSSDGEEASSVDESKTIGKNKSRTFKSTDEIYRLIPDYIRPAKDGWDSPQTRTVSEWLKDNVIGKRFKARKKIEDVTIKFDSIRRIWNVRISFENEKMSYMSWKMQEKLYPITLVGDKVFAEAAERKYKAGRTIDVSGTITTISWDSIIQRRSGENWHPKYCMIRLDADQPR